MSINDPGLFPWSLLEYFRVVWNHLCYSLASSLSSSEHCSRNRNTAQPSAYDCIASTGMSRYNKLLKEVLRQAPVFETFRPTLPLQERICMSPWILDKVFWYLYAEDLKSCSLACKHWSPAARAELFNRAVHIRDLEPFNIDRRITAFIAFSQAPIMPYDTVESCDKPQTIASYISCLRLSARSQCGRVYFCDFPLPKLRKVLGCLPKLEKVGLNGLIIPLYMDQRLAKTPHPDGVLPDLVLTDVFATFPGPRFSSVLAAHALLWFFQAVAAIHVKRSGTQTTPSIPDEYGPFNEQEHKWLRDVVDLAGLRLRAVPWIPYFQIVNNAVMRRTFKVLSLKPYVKNDFQYSWMLFKPNLIPAQPVKLDEIKLDFRDYQDCLAAAFESSRLDMTSVQDLGMLVVKLNVLDDIFLLVQAAASTLQLPPRSLKQFIIYFDDVRQGALQQVGNLTSFCIASGLRSLLKGDHFRSLEKFAVEYPTACGTTESVDLLEDLKKDDAQREKNESDLDLVLML